MQIRMFFRDHSMREALLARVERVTELPLLTLSFAMVPLLAASLFWELTPRGDTIVFFLDAIVWAVFAADLSLKAIIAPDRRAFLRGHWLEVLIVLIPFARPFWILRIIVYGTRAFKGAFRIFQVDFLVVYAIGFVLVFATIVTTVERNVDSPLSSFPNAMWWAVATVTTVGYGDMVPQTPLGRALGVVLMVCGIGLFGALTANFAWLFVRRDRNSAQITELVKEVKALRSEVLRLGNERRGTE